MSGVVMNVLRLRRPTDRDLHGLAGAYVLDALPADEDLAFGRHLDTCEVCRLEVDELGETVARLGLAAAVTPPSGLRISVLGRAAAQRQRTPYPRPRLAPAQGGRGRRALAPIASAVAASGVTLALVGLLDSAPVDPGVAAVLASADVRTVEIEAHGGAGARVHHSPSDGRAVLVVSGLAPLPGDEVYEVWTYRAGEPQPVGYLTVDQRGSGTLTLPPIADPAVEVAVTVEPRGGSRVPRGRLVAQGALGRS